VSPAFAALAAAAVCVLALLAWRDRRRMAPPELTVLCMDFGTTRRARLEIRIDHPAAVPDWSIRRIEWLAPDGVRIAARPDDPTAARAMETRLAPRDQQGRWFSSDPTIWALYPQDSVPVHEVKLRLTLERPCGRRRRLVVSAVFPAMDWRARPEAVCAATPPRRALYPVIDRRLAPAHIEAGAP